MRVEFFCFPFFAAAASTRKIIAGFPPRRLLQFPTRPRSQPHDTCIFFSRQSSYAISQQRKLRAAGRHRAEASDGTSKKKTSKRRRHQPRRRKAAMLFFYVSILPHLVASALLIMATARLRVPRRLRAQDEYEVDAERSISRCSERECLGRRTTMTQQAFQGRRRTSAHGKSQRACSLSLSLSLFCPLSLARHQTRAKQGCFQRQRAPGGEKKRSSNAKRK